MDPVSVAGGFAGGQGNTFGGASGPATSGGNNSLTFGNLVSGGSGGFNPFANSGTAQTMSQLLQPQNIAMLAAAAVAIFYFTKRK